jgi:tetratricopeptide (TPR) repeat protein
MVLARPGQANCVLPARDSLGQSPTPGPLDFGKTGLGVSMQKLMCELCRSNNFTKDDDGFFVCDYCRTKYTPAQAKSLMVEGTVRVDRSGDALNLVKLSESALATGNHQEAYEYANRALEIDSESSAAWILKGVCCGLMPHTSDRRLAEMQYAFERAIEYSAEGEAGAVRAQCTERVLQISERAFAAGDYEASHDYSAVALLIDPNSAEAWYLKGAAAGSISNLQDRRLGEMVSAFEFAIEYAKDPESDMRERCANKAMTVAIADNAKSRQFATYSTNVAAGVGAHLTRTQEALTVLAHCYQWNGSRLALEHYLDIATKLMPGVPYMATRGGATRRVTATLPADYKAHLQSQIDWARDRIREIDPTFGAQPTKTSAWSLLRGNT